MDTIYLVAKGPYLEDVLEGYATTGAEIRQIVANSYESYQYIDTNKLDIRVNLLTKEVTIKEDWGDDIYYIHAIQRVEDD